MTREDFKELAKRKPVILDGATGSNLIAAGKPRGVCTEQWVLEHPDIITDLQRRYRKAGSDIVYAATFSANRVNLEDWGLADKLADMNAELVKLTRKAVGDDCLVAGDITTTGKTDIEYDTLIEVYKEQIKALAAAGADLIAAETMIGVEETMAAAEACRDVCSLPVMCSFTIESDGSLIYGGNIFDAIKTLADIGADAVGINCSTGPDKLESVVRNMRAVVDIPLIVKPNAGLPTITETGDAVYSMGADEFSDCMKALYDAGADIIGGCCGTTPEYIEKTVKKCRKA